MTAELVHHVFKAYTHIPRHMKTERMDACTVSTQAEPRNKPVREHALRNGE